MKKKKTYWKGQKQVIGKKIKAIWTDEELPINTEKGMEEDQYGGYLFIELEDGSIIEVWWGEECGGIEYYPDGNVR